MKILSRMMTRKPTSKEAAGQLDLPEDIETEGHPGAPMADDTGEVNLSRVRSRALDEPVEPLAEEEPEVVGQGWNDSDWDDEDWDDDEDWGNEDLDENDPARTLSASQDKANLVSEIRDAMVSVGKTPLVDEKDSDVPPQRDQNGWNDDAKAYTIAYGDDELDAAVLFIGLYGLLPPNDARFVSTIKAIERDLRKGEMVYRYRLDDGLPGEEGGFLICTSWLIEAYVLIGQLDDARTLFRRYLELAGDTGLLCEEYDPNTGVMLGNHPQAYSHLGLINAALALAGATEA